MLNLRPYLWFGLVALAHLIALLYSDAGVFLVSITKPLLMPTLAWGFWNSTQANVGTEGSFLRKLALFALFWCFMGDTLLLFQKIYSGEGFFLAGLGSFLIAQLSFAFLFWKLASYKDGLLRKKMWLILPYFFYLFKLLELIFLQGIKSELVIPITFYGLAITIMAQLAVNTYPKVSKKVFWAIFSGSLFFLVSDSVLAFNKFVRPFIFSDFIVMVTYISALLLLTLGFALAINERKG